MANNDMEVIMYKILSYMYECMKAGKRPRMEDICHSCQMFQIPFDEGRKLEYRKTKEVIKHEI